MGVESFVGVYIDGLNTAWPIGASDFKSEGDDHLRGVKLVLQNTFPNITGAVNATHAELNYVDVATLGTGQASKAITVDSGGAVTMAGLTWTDLGTVTTADINGGTVDGVTIGGDAAGAGTFTTLTANNSVKTDTIAEKTATAGVTIDGFLIKDGGFDLGSDANGDIYMRSGGVLVRLGKGTAGQVLTMDSGAALPEWDSPGKWRFVETMTLSTASDEISTTFNSATTSIRVISTNADTNGANIFLWLKGASYTSPDYFTFTSDNPYSFNVDIHKRNASDNDWMMQGVVVDDVGTESRYNTPLTLDGTLTKLKFTASGTNSGTVDIWEYY